MVPSSSRYENGVKRRCSAAKFAELRRNAVIRARNSLSSAAVSIDVALRCISRRSNTRTFVAAANVVSVSRKTPYSAPPTRVQTPYRPTESTGPKRPRPRAAPVLWVQSIVHTSAWASRSRSSNAFVKRASALCASTGAGSRNSPSNRDTESRKRIASVRMVNQRPMRVEQARAQAEHRQCSISKS